MKDIGCGSIIVTGIVVFVLMVLVSTAILSTPHEKYVETVCILSTILMPVVVVVALILSMIRSEETEKKQEAQKRHEYYKKKEEAARRKDCVLCGAQWHELTEMEHAELKKEIYHYPDCPRYTP